MSYFAFILESLIVSSKDMQKSIMFGIEELVDYSKLSDDHGLNIILIRVRG